MRVGFLFALVMCGAVAVRVTKTTTFPFGEAVAIVREHRTAATTTRVAASREGDDDESRRTATVARRASVDDDADDDARAPPPPPSSSPSSSGEDWLDANRQADQVRATLSGLPDEQRKALELAYFQGMSHSEVAAEMERPLGTVKTWVRTGLLRMREQLGGAQ